MPTVFYHLSDNKSKSKINYVPLSGSLRHIYAPCLNVLPLTPFYPWSWQKEHKCLPLPCRKNNVNHLSSCQTYIKCIKWNLFLNSSYKSEGGKNRRQCSSWKIERKLTPYSHKFHMKKSNAFSLPLSDTIINEVWAISINELLNFITKDKHITWPSDKNAQKQKRFLKTSLIACKAGKIIETT